MHRQAQWAIPKEFLDEAEWERFLDWVVALDVGWFYAKAVIFDWAAMVGIELLGTAVQYAKERVLGYGKKAEGEISPHAD
jgi:hypothetical protein